MSSEDVASCGLRELRVVLGAERAERSIERKEIKLV